MGLLFVNACLREGSRTERLARMWLAGYEGAAEELRIADEKIEPLGVESLAAYNAAVASATYDDAIFSPAKQFAAADEVLIAAPFWNFSVPARLHDYLELVCSQGVTFDIDETGAYVSLVRARRLVFVTTSGGLIDAADDHAFGYVRTLANEFWHIPDVRLVMAQGLDALGVDVDALLAEALDRAAA